MFRESNSPIFRSIKLCVTICGTMYPGCCRPVAWVHYTTSCNTQSNAPEDGRVRRPKHVKLTGIINKPLLLHLVGIYIIYINDGRSNKYQIKKKLSFYFPEHCNLSEDISQPYLTVTIDGMLGNASSDTSPIKLTHN